MPRKSGSDATATVARLEAKARAGPLSGIERAQLARCRNAILRAKGELPPLPKREKGSRAAIAADPMIGALGGLPDAYTNDAIRQANLTKDTPSVEITTDEWYKQISSGATDAFTEVGNQYKGEHPDRHYRYMAPLVMARRHDRGYVTQYDKEGKPVIVQGQELRWIPEREWEARQHTKREIVEREAQKPEDSLREAAEMAARLEQEGKVVGARMIPPGGAIYGQHLGQKVMGHKSYKSDSLND